MSYYFFAPTAGWYSDDFHGARYIIDANGDSQPNPESLIPLDAVIVSDADYEVLKGKHVAGDENGYPREVPPPPVTEGEQIYVLDTKLRQANTQITALQGRVDAINDAIRFEEALPEEIDELPLRITQLTAWQKYRINLGRVKTAAGWYLTPAWPAVPEPYTSETSAITVSAQ